MALTFYLIIIVQLLLVGGEVFETVDSDVHADSRDSQEMALRTADKLLKVIVNKCLLYKITNCKPFEDHGQCLGLHHLWQKRIK